MSAPNIFSTKSDAAYAEVRRRILAGELAPGSVLDQYTLSDSMGMSITPLREALRRLRGEGLIDIDVHKNTRVTPLTATEARELFEIRMALDPAAAELAAQRRTNTDITTLRSAAKHLVPVTRTWGEKGLLAHSAFHRAIYVASHNDNLIGILDGLWDKSDRYRRLGLMLPSGAEARERDFVEHRKMMEMIVDGDAPGVADLMRQHIRLSLTVTEICMAVGFSSLGSFSSRFTQLVDETPTAYRNRWAAAGGPRVPGCYLFMCGVLDPGVTGGARVSST